MATAWYSSPWREPRPGWASPEQGQQHVQVGNLGLQFKIIKDWPEILRERGSIDGWDAAELDVGECLIEKAGCGQCLRACAAG